MPGKPEVGQSRWLFYFGLEWNGWKRLGPHDRSYNQELDRLYNAMGWNKSAHHSLYYIKNTRSSDDLNRTNLDKGIYWTATQAYYRMNMNLDAGLIVIQAAFGTWFETDPVDVSPPLNHFSDIMWLSWSWESYLQKRPVTGIRWFAITDVINDLTDDVLSFIRPKAWPGRLYDAHSPHGEALLGSPNGLAIGYFLGQHVEKLGRFRIVDVRVWDGSGSHILFQVAPVSPSIELLPD